MYPEKLSQLAALVTFIAQPDLLPAFILGVLGMPRRYASYPPEFQILNVFSTAGATILGVGYMLPVALPALVAEVRGDRRNNPWQATGLEWQTQSPPITENFVVMPVMDHEAYDYEWLESQNQAQQQEEVPSAG